MSLFLFLAAFLLSSATGQTTQKIALCYLQSALGNPRLLGWSTGNCTAPGSTDAMIRGERWAGINWTTTRPFMVTHITLSRSASLPIIDDEFIVLLCIYYLSILFPHAY
jgi:hypothetical protein